MQGKHNRDNYYSELDTPDTKRLRAADFDVVADFQSKVREASKKVQTLQATNLDLGSDGNIYLDRNAVLRRLMSKQTPNIQPTSGSFSELIRSTRTVSEESFQLGGELGGYKKPTPCDYGLLGNHSMKITSSCVKKPDAPVLSALGISRQEAPSVSTAGTTKDSFVDFLKESIQLADIIALSQLQVTMLEQLKEPHTEESKDVDGLVWKIVGAIQAMIDSASKATLPEAQSIHKAISMVNMRGLVVGATRFAKTQQRLRWLGMPHHVDIGYQYILCDHQNNFLEDLVGPSSSGIYTSNDPFAHYPHLRAQEIEGSNKKIVGFLVARVSGGSAHIVAETNAQAQSLVFLPKADQCLPLVSFEPANRVVDTEHDNALGNQVLYNHHCRLQEIMDAHFNDCVPTQVSRAFPSQYCGPLAPQYGSLPNNETVIG